MHSRRGITLIEVVLYVALFTAMSLAVVQLILNTQNAFAHARIQRKALAQGNTALERIARELRLAGDVDAAASVMDAHPGTLQLNTVVSPTDSTPITRTFYLASGTLMMQEGTAAAIPLTSGVRVTNLIFRDAGKSQASSVYYYVRGSYAGCSDSNTGLTPQTAFCTIAKAATLATAGTTVLVGAGMYAETVVLTHSGTAVQPIAYVADVGGTQTGDAGTVTVDGGTYGFQFTSAGSDTGVDYTVIEGFTITGALYGVWGGQGSDANSIRNNIITGNTDGIRLTTTWGNGMFIPGTNWTIEFNSIYGNTNGIYFDDGEYTGVLVQFNQITTNSEVGILTSDRGNGGFEPANAVTIQHNEISGNTEQGILSHPWFDGVFFDNHIYGNGDEGFWVVFRSSGTPEVINFRNNTVRANGNDGLLFGNESDRSSVDASSVIENNIVSGNGESGIDTTLNQCAVIRNNDVWGNTGSAYQGCPSQTGSNGNIALDPWYVGPAAGVHRQGTAAGHAVDSPALGAGYQFASDAGLTGRWTRSDSVADSGTVDMGYHYGNETPGVQQYFAGDPASQAIRVEMTVVGGQGTFEG